MKTCPKCKKIFQKNLKFCTSCGSELLTTGFGKKVVDFLLIVVGMFLLVFGVDAGYYGILSIVLGLFVLICAYASVHFGTVNSKNLLESFIKFITFPYTLLAILLTPSKKPERKPQREIVVIREPHREPRERSIFAEPQEIMERIRWPAPELIPKKYTNKKKKK